MVTTRTYSAAEVSELIEALRSSGTFLRLNSREWKNWDCFYVDLRKCRMPTLPQKPNAISDLFDGSAVERRAA